MGAIKGDTRSLDYGSYECIVSSRVSRILLTQLQVRNFILRSWFPDNGNLV